MRQGNLHHLGAEVFQLLDGCLDRLLHLGVHALGEILFRQADFHALDVRTQGLREVGHLRCRGGGIHLVAARDDVEDVRRIRNVTRQGADLIQRGGIGHETIAGNAAIGRFQADDAAEGGRLADGAARIGAEGPDGRARSHRRRAAARGATRYMVECPGVVRRMEGGVLRRAAHSELIEVRLAEDDRRLHVQLRHDRRVVGWHEVVDDFRGAGRLHALGADIILDGARDACEERDFLPARDFLISGLCLLLRLLARRRDVGLHVTFDSVEAAEYIRRQFLRRDFFLDQHVVQDMGRFIK